MLVQLLSKASKQLKEHCALLSSEEKQSLYSKVLNEVKNTPRDSRDGIDQLKKLSKVAVAIEETIDSKLLEKFNDGHPLREINIAYASGEATNYLFSLSDSSELYDLKENREKAIYQAIKSDDRELVKHLLMILVSGDIEIEFFKELEMLLSGAYEELKEKLSQDMKNYLEKNISLKRFVCSNVNILVAEPVDVRAEPLKHLLRLAELERKYHENSQKPEKVNEEKKAKPEEPKKEVCPPKKPAAGMRQERNYFQGCNSDWRKKRNQGNNNTYQASSQSAKNNKDASDTQGAVLKSQPIPKPVSNKGTSGQPNGRAPGESVQKSATKQSIKSSVADCGFDFNIGLWNGAENEPKQSSVNDAQENPKSKVTDVLNERAARGNSNTPSR